MNKFRKSCPQRTCTEKYSNYKSYKSYLRSDFNHKCGYTDCSDFWFGGSSTFHIDHFKPKSKYPHMVADYSNLVYCCSYVNIQKSNDDSLNYLDPCEINYNDHFQRDSLGIIKPLTNEARYMYKKLKLYLKRYQIIWLLDELREKKNMLAELIKKTQEQDTKSKLSALYIALDRTLEEYMTYLESNQ